MTIEHTDFASVVDDSGMADLHLRVAEIIEATAAAERAHAAYNWVWVDEIECRGCGARLEIPHLKSNNTSADLALEKHQREQSRRIISSWENQQ